MPHTSKYFYRPNRPKDIKLRAKINQKPSRRTSQAILFVGIPI